MTEHSSPWSTCPACHGSTSVEFVKHMEGIQARRVDGDALMASAKAHRAEMDRAKERMDTVPPHARPQWNEKPNWCRDCDAYTVENGCICPIEPPEIPEAQYVGYYLRGVRHDPKCPAIDARPCKCGAGQSAADESVTPPHGIAGMSRSMDACGPECYTRPCRNCERENLNNAYYNDAKAPSDWRKTPSMLDVTSLERRVAELEEKLQSLEYRVLGLENPEYADD